MKTFFITLTLISFLFVRDAVLLAEPTNAPTHTVLEINNSYGVGALLESKCDYDNATKKFRFYKKVKMKGKSKAIVRVPRGMKKCEIWVLEVYLFGG